MVKKLSFFLALLIVFSAIIPANMRITQDADEIFCEQYNLTYPCRVYVLQYI